MGTPRFLHFSGFCHPDFVGITVRPSFFPVFFWGPKKFYDIFFGEIKETSSQCMVNWKNFLKVIVNEVRGLVSYFMTPVLLEGVTKVASFGVFFWGWLPSIEPSISGIIWRELLFLLEHQETFVSFSNQFGEVEVI